MKVRKHLIIFLFIIVLLAPKLAQASAHQFAGQTLKVGGDNNYPPYEFMDKDNFRGFNVDVIRTIAIELGIEIELVADSWANTMDSLIQGQVQAVQGMTVTPEREENYDFTEAIVTNSQNIFVLNSRENISDIEDLPGKRIAIQSADVTKEILADIENITILEKINQEEALSALIKGEVDAYVGNRLTGIYYVQNLGLTETVKIVGDSLYSTDYSIAVKKGDQELLNLLNQGLREIKENGSYDKIYQKWFGETIPQIDQNLKRLLFVSLGALLLALLLILVIYYWNKILQKEVDIRAQEIIQLNQMALHNDKMQALGQISASMAHELRNPLTSIKAFVDLIPSKIEDSAFREQLTTIVPKEINRLNDLVSSLLDYSKPKNPRPNLINLETVLDEVITLLKQKIRDKSIKLDLQTNNLQLFVDESQLKQILINILINSIDAIEPPGTISIKCRQQASFGKIEIKDSGAGMSEEDQKRLFDPFFSSKKTSYGIGLSVTQRLVKENKGSIEVESEIGKGTSMIIKLPVEDLREGAE